MFPTHVIDVKGAFLLADFLDGEIIYMKMPQAWEELYEDERMLRLKKTVYGTKRARRVTRPNHTKWCHFF